MSPIRSSLSKSASKLLNVFRQRDLELRGYKQLTKKGKKSILTVPSAIAASEEWDLDGNPLVISTTATYDISASPKNVGDFSITTHIWGAGGGSGSPIGGPSGGGAGGFSVGDFALTPGTTFKFVIGSSDATPTNPGQPSGHGANAGCGGGYSGVFTTSVSQANAIIMAGGGGGTGGNDGGTMGSGGAGGGATAQDGSAAGGYGDSPGDGGTQSAGGSGGTGSNNGGNGTALQGGAGGARGGSGAGGGGGGSGYYGGGGGAGQSAINTGGGGGGGGSGYLHPSLITNGTTTTGSGKTRVETSPFTPLIPSTASKGNTQSNELSLPGAPVGGAGCIVVELA